MNQPTPDPQREIIAALYEQLRTYAVDIMGTENPQVWNALRTARRYLWPDLEPDSADPQQQEDEEDQEQEN